MFEINRFKYIDIKTRSKFEIYSRKVEFADELVERINKLGVFNLRRAKIFFKKKMATDIPPYEVEQEQVETISGWEARQDGTTKK